MLHWLHRFSTREAVVLAAKELKKCWLSFGGGFEKDIISTKTLELRLEGIRKTYISLNKTRTRHRGDANRLALWEKYKGQIVYPLGKGLQTPIYTISRKYTGIKVLGKAKETKLVECDERLDEATDLKVKIGRAVLTVPTFDRLMDIRLAPSAWLFPTVGADSEGRPAVDGDETELNTLHDGREEDDSAVLAEIDDGSAGYLTSGAESYENLCDKSTQANLCPCPPLRRSVSKITRWNPDQFHHQIDGVAEFDATT